MQLVSWSTCKTKKTRKKEHAFCCCRNSSACTTKAEVSFHFSYANLASHWNSNGSRSKKSHLWMLFSNTQCLNWECRWQVIWASFWMHVFQETAVSEIYEKATQQKFRIFSLWSIFMSQPKGHNFRHLCFLPGAIFVNKWKKSKRKNLSNIILRKSHVTNSQLMSPFSRWNQVP